MFENATQTQCDFYRVLKRDAIRARPLFMCTYAIIVVVKLQQRKYLRCVENFTQVQIRSGSGLGKSLRIHIDLDPRSLVHVVASLIIILFFSVVSKCTVSALVCQWSDYVMQYVTLSKWTMLLLGTFVMHTCPIDFLSYWFCVLISSWQ